ncbi:MAG: nuclear transport factor 2 family protein [Acidobacteria bacterium]|nr:nuclear transport factor 2 family protein [Acidobacteriota bacterium]
MKNRSPMRCRAAVLAAPLVAVVFAACIGTEKPGAVPEKTMHEIGQRLKDLEDREEIRRLLIDYGRFLDRRDFESFALLFAENEGEWVGGMGKARGRDAIRRLMEETIGTGTAKDAPGSYHLFTNDRIDLDGDRAVASTRWIFVVQNGAGRPEPFYLGHYEDTLARENGKWRFLRRVAYSDIPRENPETGEKD